MKEKKNNSCVFQSDNEIVVCLFDELLIFAKCEKNIRSVKSKFNKDLIMIEIGVPSSILGIELSWRKKQFILVMKDNFRGR